MNETIERHYGPNNIDLSRLETVLNLANQNMSKLIQTFETQIPVMDANQSSLSVTYSSAGGTTATVGSGLLKVISVTAATTSASAFIYDANSPANVGSSNIMTLIPSSGILYVTMPFQNGLTIQPSSVGSHRVSVFYV